MHPSAASHQPAALLKTTCTAIPVIAFYTPSIVSNRAKKVNTDLCFPAPNGFALILQTATDRPLQSGFFRGKNRRCTCGNRTPASRPYSPFRLRVLPTWPAFRSRPCSGRRFRARCVPSPRGRAFCAPAADGWDSRTPAWRRETHTRADAGAPAAPRRFP